MRRCFNLIRYRAGLPGITASETADRQKMRELIERAANRPKVEEDVGVPDHDDVALPAPSRELLASLRKRFPPQWVGCHDVDPAQRQADGVQIPNHALGEFNEPGIDTVVRFVRIDVEDERSEEHTSELQSLMRN